MVTLKLYNFNKKLNSTARPASDAGTSFSGLLVDPCSILNPVIKLENVVAYNFNYAYIQEFDRYYFVEDWHSEQGFWFLQLRIDALGTWKAVIGSSTQYVERSQSQQNEYIVDTQYPTSGKMTHSQVQIEAGLHSDFNNGWFALNITGSESNTTVGSYLCEWATFKNVISEMLLLNDDDTFWANLAQGIRNSIAKPFEHLGSVVWFAEPYFDPLASSAVHSITLGSVTLTSTSTKPMTFYPSGFDIWQSSTLNVPKHPQANTYGKYMNLKPYTRYVYRDDLTGDVELDPLQLIDKTTFTVWKCTDPLTGTQIIALPDGQTRVAQAGVLVPMENNSLNIGGIINSVIDTAASVISKKPLNEIASSVVSATEALLPTVTSTSQQGATVLNHRGIWLDAYFWNSVGHDVGDFGNPYCQTSQISNLSGFILCNGAHISALNMSASESQLIEEYMNSGFFYE